MAGYTDTIQATHTQTQRDKRTERESADAARENGLVVVTHIHEEMGMTQRANHACKGRLLQTTRGSLDDNDSTQTRRGREMRLT
jgi:hypothetical protein